MGLILASTTDFYKSKKWRFKNISLCKSIFLQALILQMVNKIKIRWLKKTKSWGFIAALQCILGLTQSA